MGQYSHGILCPWIGTVKVGSVIVGFEEDNMFYAYEDDMPEGEKLLQKEKYRALTL